MARFRFPFIYLTYGRDCSECGHSLKFLAQPQTHACYQCSLKSYENALAQPWVDNVDKQQTDTGQVMVTSPHF